MDDKDIVSALLACVAEKVGQERFDLWLAGHARLSVREGSLLVELQSRFAQDWVRSHFRGEIEAACVEVLGKSTALEFRVDKNLARSTAAPKVAARASSNGKSNCDNGAPLRGDNDNAGNHPLRLSPATTDSSDSHSRAPGPRGFTRRKFASLDSFVVGSSNRLAHATAQLVAEQPGRYSPLFVHGPTGVGKTHLLEGIWNAARARSPNLHAVYLSAEQFTTYFVEALNGSGLPNFRRKYRGVELLIIDDVQFFEGKKATLGELLHTTDALLREGRQLILASDKCPVGLRSVSGELATRVGAGMVCGIDSPDFQTRVGILRRLADKIGFALADDVAELIATHLTSHARELSGAINRLEAASRILQQPITRAIAEEALAEMIRHGARSVKLIDIDKAVCDVFGLEAAALHSSRRAKTVSQPRMLAMWLARKHTRAPLAEIGEHFGRRSHSTVISAHKTVNGWVAKQTKIELSGKDWNVEDAIRRVEEHLRQA